MAKKLVTADQNLISKVENVLKSKHVPCAKIALSEESGLTMLVTINRFGEEMCNALKSIKTKSKYHFGVLRGHWEYAVPNRILIELSNEKAA